MVDAQLEQLFGRYRRYIRNIEEPDDLCSEVLLLLVARDEFAPLALSDDNLRRLAELDDQLIRHWETLAECLPYPTPHPRQNWWWFLHEGPQVRETTAPGAPAAQPHP